MAGTFLLVEDDADQIRLVYGILEEIGAGIEPVICGDGVEAIDSLASIRNTPAHLRPSLMVLDLKLPRRDGYEVLKFARTNEDLRGFPIVVLSESGTEADIAHALECGATAYFVKPFAVMNNAHIFRAVFERHAPGACVAPARFDPTIVNRYFRGPGSAYV